jgi:hypothetical protein
VMFGHSGSTSGHPVVMSLSRAVAAALPDAWIVYGGVFPTYHFREVLSEEPQIDAIVRGEGEETTRRLVRALEEGLELSTVTGIAFRRDGRIRATEAATVIADLDAYRVGWELIDFRRYSYWGEKALLQVWWAHERRGVTVWAGGSASSRRSVEWGGGGDRARTAPGVSGRFPRHPNPPARPCAPPHCSRRPSASSQPSSRGSSLSPTGSSATFGRPRESLDAAGARAVSGKAMTPGNHACGDTSTWAE